MIIKRYTRPFAFESVAVRAQFAEFARDGSTGIAIKGPVIEQDLQFADGCNPEIIAAMDGLMARAGWTHAGDAPADEPGLLLTDGGSERKLSVKANQLDLGDKKVVTREG